MKRHFATFAVHDPRKGDDEKKMLSTQKTFTILILSTTFLQLNCITKIVFNNW